MHANVTQTLASAPAARARRRRWARCVPFAGGLVVKAVAVLLILLLPWLVRQAPTFVDVTLGGSPESMVRQYVVARASRLVFARTPADVARMVMRGGLVPAPGNGDYRLKGVEYAFAHPATRTFIEHTARAYRRACREPLVVTSLVRPLDRQPGNAHPLSVHPTGLAVDLSIPDRPECRAWLEGVLITLEARGVLDVTAERRPPHLHVAVFPGAYARFVNRPPGDSAAAPGRARAREPAGTPAGGRAVWWAVGGVLLVLVAGTVGWWGVRRSRRGGRP
ncbi:MAG TPA: DUF5715 family protein [Longimicrobiales bacterium]